MNDIGNGGLKSIREDPETTKKKEIHKNLMNEALKKVELRNNQKKNFSQLARTNPTLAALSIVTRKELKMEEMEAAVREAGQGGGQEEEEQRKLEKLREEQQGGKAAAGREEGTAGRVNSGVLQSFREQSIRQPAAASQAARQALIQAKKAGTPARGAEQPRPCPAPASHGTGRAGGDPP